MSSHPRVCGSSEDGQPVNGHALRSSRVRFARLGATVIAAGISAAAFCGSAAGQVMPPIAFTVPSELNPKGGGAPKATPEQAGAFAWQEFVALNWPAVPQGGQVSDRGTPSPNCRFGDPSARCSLLTWETFRSKVEIFPGDGNPPPGYVGSNGQTSWGYDALPQYHYVNPVRACDPSQANDPTPWINLDETDEITLANMYAGVVQPDASPGNSAPQLIRFLAKANREEYVYVAGNSRSGAEWWNAVPQNIVQNTKDFLKQFKRSPPADSGSYVSLPFGTIEIKAGWRPLNPNEISSGRFHTQVVRFYEYPNGPPPDGDACYRDAVWGLVGLHIIQKTASAPYFIYATFEQADNILDKSGKPVEDVNGRETEHSQAPTEPQVCLQDPKPSGGGSSFPSTSGTVTRSLDPAACRRATVPYCASPGSRLFYRNAPDSIYPPPNNEPNGGDICVNSRYNPIPDYVVQANERAHTAIANYLRRQGIAGAPWLYYKLINVQFYPFDKIPNPAIPNGSPYTSKPPYSAGKPAASSFYLANIVVETNRSLQLFSGGLSPAISTDWNQDGSFHKNTFYDGRPYNMGGCMGCHGSQGQNPAFGAGDFSVILARGAVRQPEGPSHQTSQGLTPMVRNRTLQK